MLRTKKGTLILSLLAVVMAVCLAFGVKTFAPSSSVQASDAHVHCFCGSAPCSESLHDDALVWTEWDAKSDLTVSGNYYLADSVGTDETTANITISADVNLCLNGKTLDLGAYGLLVNEGATLTVCDCVGGGVITATRVIEENTPTGGTIELSGKLNLYSGTLTHYRNDTYMSEYFCAVNVATTGELNVFGRTITGEKSLSINNLGTVTVDGGSVTQTVYNGFTRKSNNPVVIQTAINPATLTVKSGEINCANTIANSKASVLNAGTLNVEGGRIHAGAKIAVLLYFGGSMTVSGGTVSSEKDTCIEMGVEWEGNVSHVGFGTVTVSDGTVTTSAYKDGVYDCYAIDCKDIRISGGVISNTNPEASYALNLKGDLYLSGTPSITTALGWKHLHYNGTNIYANDGKSNPTYYEGETIKMMNTTSIGSKLYQPVIYGLKDEAQGEKFVLEDYEKHRLQYENNQLILVPEHAHCIGACATCTDTTHKICPNNGFPYNYVHKRNNEINFTKYTYESNLPYEDYFQGGNFERFLGCDINTTNNRNRIQDTSFLCLNGYDVNGNNLETISGTGTLVITDCTGEGSIKGIIIADGGTLMVYSGRIGEITVQDGATLLLFGGIYAQKFDNATIPAGYGWVENTDSATKTQYPYRITAVKTITFDANGGEGEMANQGVEAGVQSTLSGNEFTMQGYEFGGWSTSEDGVKVYDDLGSITISDDVTLYAVWNPRNDTPYVVEHYFENLDGEFLIDASKTQNLVGVTATSVTAQHLTNVVGFTADQGNADSFATSTVLPDGSLVLKLYYVRTTHTITVAINNPSYGRADNPVIQNVKYGTQITVDGNVVTVGGQTITVTASAQTSTNSFYFVDITGGNCTVDGDQTITANFITRVRVNKPNSDDRNFIYDGTEKTYNIPANAKYTVEGNKQTEIGVYQVIVSLVDKDGCEWIDGTNTDLVYEFIVKVGQQSFVDENSEDKSKPSVVVSSPTGIAPDITLVVVDKTEDEAVIEKLPSEKKFVVEKIYDISLEKNGDNVQVSEVGGLITIKILISEELKADDIKLYHIHGDEEGVEIKRGRAGVVNEYVIEGDYAIITIDRLSEFAFVKEQVENYWWAWLIGVEVLAALILVALVNNVKKCEAREEALREERRKNSPKAQRLEKFKKYKRTK